MNYENWEEHHQEELIDLVYSYLIESNIATDNEISLVTSINGYDLQSLNDVLYVRTGYHDLEQYTESEDKDFYNEYFSSFEKSEDDGIKTYWDYLESTGMNEQQVAMAVEFWQESKKD